MSELCRENKGKDETSCNDFLVPEENVNVALVREGASMVKPGQKDSMLQGKFTDYDNFSSHGIYDQDENNPGLVVKLRCMFLLNRLTILLWDRDERSYSYYVEVSFNGKQWMKIVDHTKYKCRSWQSIAFPEMVLQYIRIVGTHNTVDYNFDVIGIKAFRFTLEDVKLNRKWEPILGTLVPNTNVATPARGAKVILGKAPEFLLNGQTTGYTVWTGYTFHTIGVGSGGICVQLSQPYILSSVKLLLWDGDARQFHYIIEVSTDNSTWTCVCNRSNAKSWQTVTFDPLPVLFIRLLGLHNSVNAGFHVVHFECPASSD